MSGIQPQSQGEQEEMIYKLFKPCLLVIALISPFISWGQQVLEDSLTKALSNVIADKDHRAELVAYCKRNVDDGVPSTSSGTVGKGALLHGKLIPFQGDNFRYYDTLSYLDDRAFVNGKVKEVVLAAYADMKLAFPDRMFTIMECSKKDGGKIWPHRTHQNGLSIDFMVPMVQEGQPYYGLDSLGFSHYLLEFDDNGSYPDIIPAATIDLDIVAAHLLSLQHHARMNGLEVAKVLLKVEFLDDLSKTPAGTKLKASGIYFPTQLEPLINGLHDNHYHVDFKFSQPVR